MIYENIPTIEVADSRFLGFVKVINTKTEATIFRSSLKKAFPDAAHIPICWAFNGSSNAKGSCGYDEDGEPENSCGSILMKETKNYFEKYSNAIIDLGLKKVGSTDSDEAKLVNEGKINDSKRDCNDEKGLVLAIVRFFGHKLLGVTCGRLSQCYQSIGILTLHRFFHGKDVALHQRFEKVTTSKYGLGAGDCEIILDVLSGVDGSDDPVGFPQQLANELNFDGFKGNLGEELPRLQNLQANVTEGFIPVYRYPGNYKGDEWKTFQWTKTSLKVKNAVEESLKPLVDQEMNHCVTNFYRDGNDFIDHHSDKDLDLDKNAVIVSVSLGDERYLELRRRAMPKDTLRIKLPHGSMLVLGPKTNKTFTHSILKKKGSTVPRMSLTLRHVVTFMDLRTNRLFGEGSILSTHDQLKNKQSMENTLFTSGFASLALFVFRRGGNLISKARGSLIKDFLSISTLFALSFATFQRTRLIYCQYNEERRAREFFSKTSVNGTKY